MSMLKAEVVNVKIYPHPNADRLEIAQPVGKEWRCVTGKGTYKDGDLAVYLPVDSVLTPSLVKDLGIEKYYNKRLRTVKLRGTISQGMIAPLSILEGTGFGMLGDDVTETLGITKYEEPIPVSMSGRARSPHPLFTKFADIENYKNFPDVFELGETVIVTEKLHGTNARFGMFDDGLHVGSHRMDWIDDPNNLYWRGATILKVKEWLKLGDILFGEIFGKGVQDLHYSMPAGEIDVRVFGMVRAGKFLDYDEFIKVLPSYVKPAPLLHHGPWINEIIKLASGTTTMGKREHIREGVVVHPAKERYSEKLQGRCIVKMINDEYLVRHDGTEAH